jgi:branched-chain amino acid transport system permease protein
MTEGVLAAVATYLINGLAAVGPILLVAVGLTTVLSAVRAINVAVGIILAFGGFASIWAADHFGATMAVLAAIMVPVGLAVVIEIAVLRPQRSRVHDVEIASFAATLGVSIVLTAIAANATNSAVVALPPTVLLVRQVLQVDNYSVPVLALITFAVAATSTAGLAWFLHNTSHGRLHRALAADANLARTIGARVDLIAIEAAALSGLLVGLAALLVVLQLRDLDLDTASNYLLLPFAAVILGGLGSLRGTVGAAFFFGFVQATLVNFTGNPAVQDVITFGLLFVLLTIRPQGLVGQMLRTREY